MQKTRLKRHYARIETQADVDFRTNVVYLQLLEEHFLAGVAPVQRLHLCQSRGDDPHELLPLHFC